MSHTTTRPRRLGRLTAGLTVAAAAAATTLLGAAPAHAQTNVVTARVVGGNLSINGTIFADKIIVTGSATVVTLSNSTGSIQAAGFGCTQAGATVNCTGMNQITFVGSDGNDRFENKTSVLSRMFGGEGNDILRGGTSNLDSAFGGNGQDLCRAEFKDRCEV